MPPRTGRNYRYTKFVLELLNTRFETFEDRKVFFKSLFNNMNNDFFYITIQSEEFGIDNRNIFPNKKNLHESAYVPFIISAIDELYTPDKDTPKSRECLIRQANDFIDFINNDENLSILTFFGPEKIAKLFVKLSLNQEDFLTTMNLLKSAPNITQYPSNFLYTLIESLSDLQLEIKKQPHFSQYKIFDPINILNAITRFNPTYIRERPYLAFSELVKTITENQEVKQRIINLQNTIDNENSPSHRKKSREQRMRGRGFSEEESAAAAAAAADDILLRGSLRRKKTLTPEQQKISDLISHLHNKNEVLKIKDEIYNLLIESQHFSPDVQQVVVNFCEAISKEMPLHDPNQTFTEDKTFVKLACYNIILQQRIFYYSSQLNRLLELLRRNSKEIIAPEKWIEIKAQIDSLYIKLKDNLLMSLDTLKTTLPDGRKIVDFYINSLDKCGSSGFRLNPNFFEPIDQYLASSQAGNYSLKRHYHHPLFNLVKMVIHINQNVHISQLAFRDSNDDNKKQEIRAFIAQCQLRLNSIEEVYKLLIVQHNSTIPQGLPNLSDDLKKEIGGDGNHSRRFIGFIQEFMSRELENSKKLLNFESYSQQASAAAVGHQPQPQLASAAAAHQPQQYYAAAVGHQPQPQQASAAAVWPPYQQRALATSSYQVTEACDFDTLISMVLHQSHPVPVHTLTPNPPPDFYGNSLSLAANMQMQTLPSYTPTQTPAMVMEASPPPYAPPPMYTDALSLILEDGDASLEIYQPTTSSTNNDMGTSSGDSLPQPLPGEPYARTPFYYNNHQK